MYSLRLGVASKFTFTFVWDTSRFPGIGVSLKLATQTSQIWHARTWMARLARKTCCVNIGHRRRHYHTRESNMCRDLSPHLKRYTLQAREFPNAHCLCCTIKLHWQHRTHLTWQAASRLEVRVSKNWLPCDIGIEDRQAREMGVMSREHTELRLRLIS